jgi:hypothetical protein
MLLLYLKKLQYIKCEDLTLREFEGDIFLYDDKN